MPPDKYVEGLENDIDVGGPFEINRAIPQDIKEKFEYIDGNFFHHSSESFIVKPRYKTLLFLTYDEETYLEAKKYAISCANINISEGDCFGKINSFDFYYAHKVTEYPRKFCLVGFSDETKTIVYLSMYNGKLKPNNASDLLFEDFIIDHFGEWYDFK